MTNPIQTIKYCADAGAVCVTVATIMNWAPPVAAVLSVIWLAIQIGDWIQKKVKKK